MKKLLVIAGIIAATLCTRAADGTVDATSQVNPVFDATLGKLSGNSYIVALYWAPIGSSTLTSFTTSSGGAIAPFPFQTGAGAGFWDFGANSILYAAGQAGATVQIIAHAWLASAGSFENAAHSGQIGQSSPINVILGGAGSPPTVPASIAAMQSFSIILPEPSTCALALLGGTVWMFVGCKRSA